MRENLKIERPVNEFKLVLTDDEIDILSMILPRDLAEKIKSGRYKNLGGNELGREEKEGEFEVKFCELYRSKVLEYDGEWDYDGILLLQRKTKV